MALGALPGALELRWRRGFSRVAPAQDRKAGGQRDDLRRYPEPRAARALQRRRAAAGAYSLHWDEQLRGTLGAVGEHPPDFSTRSRRFGADDVGLSGHEGLKS